MEFLIRALDGETGALGPPVLPALPATVDPLLVRAAVEFLRHTSLPIEPRRLWPAGGLPGAGVRGTIDPGLRAQPGRALCRWGDAGWGELVRHGKYQDRRFADDLVQACAALVRRWRPEPPPAWVTCVVSRRHPDLIPDFARRLAAALGLPFHPVLVQSEQRPEQKTMANSIQQARNVDGSLRIRPGRVPGGPVLLVDDVVDSRWTLTVATWLLRTHGSGEVFPLALAEASPDT
jgi:ATP-dependent DNA helicase RecQ